MAKTVKKRGIPTRWLVVAIVIAIVLSFVVSLVVVSVSSPAIAREFSTDSGIITVEIRPDFAASSGTITVEVQEGEGG